MENTRTAIRPGETRLAVDPATADDARLCFIGRIVSPWQRREDCPKNVRLARARGGAAALLLDAPFRPALAGLQAGQWVHVLSWLGEAGRDLALQTPRHAEAPRGTFALRSPVRPNPIGLHLVQILAIDLATGRIDIDAIDTLDGTALLDLKPFFGSVDLPPPPGTGPEDAPAEDASAGGAALLSAVDGAKTQ